MPHLDPDRLILIALGEQSTSAEEAQHLAGCQLCRGELATNETVARIGRGSHEVRELPAPPDQLWQRIAAEAFPDAAPQPPAQSVPGAAPQPPARSVPTPPPSGSVPARPPARSVPARPPSGSVPTRPPSRSRSRWRLALVAAAAVVVGVAAVIGVQQLGRPGADRVVAQADLLPQAAAPGTAHGTATIVDTGHGLQMRLSLSGMPPRPATTPSGCTTAAPS